MGLSDGRRKTCLNADMNSAALFGATSGAAITHFTFKKNNENSGRSNTCLYIQTST